MQVADLFATLGLVPDEKSWDKGKELIEGMHKALEAYLGFEAIKKVGELVEGTVEAAQQAKNLGEQLGISATAVQELGYAAYVSDVPIETLQGAMFRLSRGLEQLKTKGTGPAADALRKLHVNMKDLKGESLDQNLEVLANAFRNAGPEVNKSTLAMELFGRTAGPKMLLLLNKGSGGIQDLRNEAEKLGFVMGGEALERAEEFEVSQKKLHATLIGLRNEAVTAMLPMLTEMAESLGEWVRENREAIASGLKAFLTGLAEAFKFVGHAIYTVIETFKEHRELLAFLLVAIGLYAVASIAAAVSSAAAWLLAAAPFILIAAAIAGVILIVKKLWDWIENGDDVVARTIRKIFGWFSDLVQFVIGVGREIVDHLTAAFDVIVNLPVVKQLIQLVKDLRDFANMKPGGSKGAHNATARSSSSFVRGAGAANDFLNDHPILASFFGGGGEAARRDVQEKMFGAEDVPTVAAKPDSEAAGPQETTNNFGDTHIQIDATGMTPEELDAKIKDSVKNGHLDAVREAQNAVTGGKR